MSQIATDAAAPRSVDLAPAATARGAMPWPVLAVLAAFVLGVEIAMIYLYLHTLGQREIGEFIALCSGLGSLIWPFAGLGVLLKSAMATRRP